jgi:hypothetical protein
MAQKPNAIDYTALAKEAEAAVAAVKDPELKRLAFEKILQTMLDGGSFGSTKPADKEKKTANGPRPSTVSRQSRRPQGGPKTRIETLVDDGFFKKPKTIAEVKAELANRGHHIALTSLSGPLQKLTQDRRLRRQKMASKGKGSKAAYAYSNW